MAVTFDDMDVAVRKMYLPNIVNQFFKATPFLARLIARNNVRVKGGRKIAQPVMYGELPGGSYRGLDTFDTSYKETHTYAELDWKSNYVNVTIPGDDLAKADSDEEIIGLLTPKMQTAGFTIRKNVTLQAYGDGTGNGSKDMDGLQNGIDDGTNFASYASINRSTEDWWKSTINSTGGSLTLDMLQSAYGDATDGDEHPDLILMRQTLWDKLWARVQPQQRFISDDFPEMKAIGFQGFMFNQAVVIPDNYVTPDDAIYLLNTKYVFLVINQNRNFEWTPPKQPVEQDAYVRQLLLMSNLFVSAPWRCSKILNVT